jgi:hypothetical protein
MSTSLNLEESLEAAVSRVMREADCDRDTAIAALSLYVPAARELKPGLLTED